MKKTIHYFNFCEYYKKAQILQDQRVFNKNLDVIVDDPLMNNVKIYDITLRRFAGFSNALEDIKGLRLPKGADRLPHTPHLGLGESLFISLVHRYSGSGASFENDHGYRNSIVGELSKLSSMEEMKEFIVSYEGKMFTSKGNQPPSIKNPDKKKYSLASKYYFDIFAIPFIEDLVKYLDEGRDRGIKEVVDWCLDWNSSNGLKRWGFVMTAFVMDIAEYYGLFVDKTSHCYHGKNAANSLKLMFEKEKSDKLTKSKWEEAMYQDLRENLGCNPYDVEDVLCDYIRYIEEFVPNKDYEHLSEEQKKNNSLLKLSEEEQMAIVERGCV